VPARGCGCASKLLPLPDSPDWLKGSVVLLLQCLNNYSRKRKKGKGLCEGLVKVSGGFTMKGIRFVKTPVKKRKQFVANSGICFCFSALIRFVIFIGIFMI
jgi:hypothetical protein